MAKTSTIEQWREAGTHDVWMPSGAEIVLRFPSLPELVKANRVPETLRAAALQEISRSDGLPLFLKAALGMTAEPKQGEPPTQEEVAETYALGEWLITQMCVEPEVTLEDIPLLPAEDKDMLFLLAARARMTDARGRKLGVTALEDLAPFPQLHGCPQGCEACASAAQALSTSHAARLV